MKPIIVTVAAFLVGGIAGLLLGIYTSEQGGLYLPLVGAPVEGSGGFRQRDCERWFTEGLGMIVEGGKRGFIDKTGRVVIAPQFKKAWGFSEGLAAVSVDRKIGFIDRTGKVVIPPTFELACGFNEGLAAVEMNGVWGFIDKKGKWVVEPRYKSVFGEFREGLAAVEVGGKWGFINREGKMVVQAVYDYAGRFFDGLAVVVRGERWGYIDRSGTVRIELQFSGAWDYDGYTDCALVRIPGGRKDMWGRDLPVFVDKHGRVKLVPQADVDVMGMFSPGLAMARKVGTVKYGYIDETGAWAIPPRFDRLWDFTGELAAVMTAGKWGYINKTGKFVIAPNFDEAESFAEGLAQVVVDGRLAYINASGDVIWQEAAASTQPSRPATTTGMSAKPPPRP